MTSASTTLEVTGACYPALYLLLAGDLGWRTALSLARWALLLLGSLNLVLYFLCVGVLKLHRQSKTLVGFTSPKWELQC